jgi:hypothetical protein
MNRFLPVICIRALNEIEWKLITKYDFEDQEGYGV